MPYPEEFIDLATDRVVGSTQHVADHARIAAEINAIAQDLMGAKGSDASLSARLAAIAAGLLPENAADGLFVGRQDGVTSWLPPPVSSGLTPVAPENLFPSFDGKSLAVNDDAGAAGYIDPFALVGGISPRMFGAPQNDLNIDSTDEVQAAVNLAIALRRPVRLDGNYRTFDTITASSNFFAAEGVGEAASGLYLSSTITGKAVLLVKSPGGASGYAPSGYVKGFRVDGGRTRPFDMSAGIRLEAMRRFTVESINPTGLDIGVDTVGNCYGSYLVNCACTGDNVNVGCNLRGSTPAAPSTAGSGSDIVMVNCAWGGHFAALWCGPNAGGYHMFGGFLGGGGTLAAENDWYGSLMWGLSYEPIALVAANAAVGATAITLKNVDGTASVGSNVGSSGTVAIGEQLIPYTSKSGDVITLTSALSVAVTANMRVQHVGGLGTVNLYGVSWEGTTKRHAERGHQNIKGLNHLGCSFNSNGLNRVISVVKLTNGGNYNMSFSGCGVQGTWTGAVPLNLSASPNFSNFHVDEHSTWTSTPTPCTFNGVQMAFGTRPMVSYSGLTRAAASFEDKIFFGGRMLRFNAAVLESSGDGGTTWTAV